MALKILIAVLGYGHIDIGARTVFKLFSVVALKLLDI